MSSVFLHFMSGLLFAAATALTSGLFHGFHYIDVSKTWGVLANTKYDGQKMVNCDEFLEKWGDGDVYHNFTANILPNVVREDLGNESEDWTLYLGPTVRLLVSIIMIIVTIRFVIETWMKI